MEVYSSYIYKGARKASWGEIWEIGRVCCGESERGVRPPSWGIALAASGEGKRIESRQA